MKTITFNFKEIEALPTDPYSASNWPEPGVYRVMTKDEKNNLYLVNDYTVNTAHGVLSLGTTEDRSTGGPVNITEELLLKAIAAAASRQLPA